MKAALTFLFIWLAGMAAAQDLDLPALFDVQGVATDDMLNVRAGPGVSFDIVAVLKFDARNVEVTGANDDGSWLRVNTDEFAGWASARFLRRTGPDWNAGLPHPLICHGTEPFWSLALDPHGAVWSDPEAAAIPFTEIWSGSALGVGPWAHGLILLGGDQSITATIDRAACNDGMSDLEFGLSVRLIRQGPTGPALYAGCCSLAP